MKKINHLLIKRFNKIRKSKQMVFLGALMFFTTISVTHLFASGPNSGTTPLNSNDVNSLLKQQITVTGKVTDANGNALPGVNIVIEGTTTGVVTGVDGTYSISVPSQESNLVFSYVGYLPETKQVGTQTTIDVSLVESIQSLDQVVVVGYGTQTKRNVTGSIQNVDANDLSSMPVTTTEQKLQGKLAGVQITQTTGIPGEGMKVRVRGQASISAGNDPLYVVDGFPIDGDISNINPDEIQSITVLKDAASTSLYGSRAANGVILVTTKQGQAGKTQVNLSAYYGIAKLPEKGRPQIMNAEEFATYKKESYEDLAKYGPDPSVTVPSIFQNPASYAGKGTNWYDVMFRNASIQNYNLSVSSGSDKFRSSVVGGYFNQEGVMINSGYERFSLRVNTDFDVNKMIKLGFNFAPEIANRHSPQSDGIFWAGGLLNNALLAWPIFDYQSPDGTYPAGWFDPSVQTFPVPNYYIGAQKIKNEHQDLHLLSNAYIQFEPIDGLVLKSTVNLQLQSLNYKYFQPSDATGGFAAIPPVTSNGTFQNEWIINWLSENTATYTKSFGDHNINVLAGYTVQKFRHNTHQTQVRNFADDRVATINTAASIVTGNTNTYNNIQEWSLLSYLARVNYDYKGRYMLSLAIRRDGSSRFGVDNQWGNFPSVSAGWLVSDESFFPKSTISLLKLRASYGVTGNNNIGNYTQYAGLTLGDNAAIAGSSVIGAHVTNLRNPDLGWERTSQLDVGFDFGILKNRINLSYDYYKKKTTDLLYNFDIPPSSGFTQFQGNSGELHFWGHEFLITSRNFVGDFKWSTNLNVAFNNNKVISLAPGVDQIYSGQNDAHVTRIGGHIGVFNGLVWDGVYDNQAEFDNSPKASLSRVGTIKFSDQNGDGVIINANKENGGDRVTIGDPTPKFVYGMTNNLSYKNFDLSVVASGSYGNDLFNWYYQGVTNLDGVFNVLKDVKNRWRSPQQVGNGKFGTTAYNANMQRDWPNTLFVEGGSYLTIKNITLGYNLNVNNISFLSNLRVYASVQQVYTFTKYTGNNPEVSGTFNRTPTTALNLGDDYAGYPVPRTWTLGVNVGF